MLIDLTRRPVRLIFEECPHLVVLRTMRVAGQVDGKIHQEVLTGSRVKTVSRVNTLTPKITLPKGDLEFIETILPESITRVPKPTVPMRRGGMTTRYEPVIWEPPPSTEPYSVATGFDDITTKQRGQWRINLVISPAAKGNKALSVLDETSGTVLFTVQIEVTPVSEDALFKITTPLSRLLHQDNTETGMWAALQEDDEDAFS